MQRRPGSFDESVRPENPMGKTLNDERDFDKSDVAVANSVVPISMKIPPTLTEGEKRMLRNLHLRKISPKKQAQLLARSGIARKLMEKWQILPRINQNRKVYLEQIGHQQKRVQGANLNTFEPGTELEDLEAGEEGKLGFKPILKYRKASQDDYNIIVKLQRYCLKLLRIYGYIRQNKNNYYFGINFNPPPDFTIPGFATSRLEQRPENPQNPPFIARKYEMKLTWKRFFEASETRYPDNDEYGDEDLAEDNPFNQYKDRSNSNYEYRMTVEDKPPGFFSRHFPSLNARSSSKGSMIVKNFENGLRPINQGVSAGNGESKFTYIPESPGVKDEVTGGIFEILCIDVNSSKRRGGIMVHNKHTFIGPPGSWFHDDYDGEYRREYAIVIGLGMLKIMETPHDHDVDLAIKDIKFDVERILTIYCGGELWRELLKHVEIEMEGYEKIPANFGGKTRKKITNIKNKSKKIKSKKIKSKKIKSKKIKSKKIKSKTLKLYNL
jgi:hypothetical protein